MYTGQANSSSYIIYIYILLAKIEQDLYQCPRKFHLRIQSFKAFEIIYSIHYESVKNLSLQYMYKSIYCLSSMDRKTSIKRVF